MHVATLLSAPAGGAVVLAIHDGAGEHERQDVAWKTSPQQEQTPTPVPASQVPSLSPLPHALLPPLGPAASVLELARGLRLLMPVHT